METTQVTLADLIRDALKTRKAEKEVFACYENGERDRATLANNALNEHILELIDSRIAKILNTQA